MGTLTGYSDYRQFKLALDAEMKRTAEGFVKIGYMLAYAAETGIVRDGGYGNVNDFAKAEYGIDATQVSRFVNIYRRFGISGEPRLKECYMSHGVAKLGIMLTLPDAVNEEITEAYSRAEVAELKKIVDEEKKISDIEVMCEEKDRLQQMLPEGFKQLVMQFVKDYPEEYVKMYDAITMDDLKEIMAPSGESMHKVRIPGKGAYMLFAKADGDIVAASLRTPEKEAYGWEQFFDALKDYFAMGAGAKESWSNVFGEPFPEKPAEEARDTEKTDRHNAQQPKPRKESRIKTPVPKPKAKPVEGVEKEAGEQLQGQMTVADFPEYLPESMKEDRQEAAIGVAEDAGGAENPPSTHGGNVQQASDGVKAGHIAPVQGNDAANIIRGYKAGIRAALAIMEDKYEAGDWSAVYAKASDIAFRAKKIMEMEEKTNGQNK